MVTGLNENFVYLILVSFHWIVWFVSLLYRKGTLHLFHKIFLLVVSMSSTYQTIRVRRVCLLPERFADTSLVLKEPYISNLSDAI